MANLFWKTFGGFRPGYYFRHLLFGSMFLVVLYFHDQSSRHPLPVSIWVLAVITTLLYPYSRFVYESVVDYIVGDNVFITNAGVYLFVKLITMYLCWAFAIVIAPIGLIYLYVHHTREEKAREVEGED